MNHLFLQRFFSVMAAGLLALTGLTAESRPWDVVLSSLAW
jgi:hypothetical protein